MSKRTTYFSILIAAILVLAIGYILKINEIVKFAELCWQFAQQNVLAVSAAVCAFIFLGGKNYWLVMLGCAIAAALIIQFIIVGHNAGIMVWAARIITFLAIVFVMNFVRLLFNK